MVHTAIALIGLLAFSALVVDYGVLWSARRQAQNSADAGAMAGAVSLAYHDMDDRTMARASARNTALQNLIWGAAPDVTDADITFPPCPVGSPGAGSNACIRVDVFRNQRAGGNPLPTIFASLVGVADQGVKATATAEVLYGDSADCVKPWAIPDKWEEHNPDVSTWEPDDRFNRYDRSGALLSPADYYRRQGTNSQTDPGTGFTRESVTTGGDYGRYIILKTGGPQDAIAPGWFNPVVVDPDCVGGNCYRDAIAGCSPVVLGPGNTLSNEPGDMVGPTRQGVQALLDQDPYAKWDPAANDNRGAIVDSCQSASPPTCAKSPRLVAIPVYDPDEYDLGQASGRQDIVITKLLGFFIEGMVGNDVGGYLMFYPGEPRVRTTASGPTGAEFIISIALVR